MGWSVEEVMQSEVRTIGPERTLADLEQAFLEARISGFPVVDGGRLVGIVSRSDVVRQLSVEQALAETLSDYYREAAGYEIDSSVSLDQIAAQMGRRIEAMRVSDVMVKAVVVAAPSDPLPELARTMVDRNIHRVPIVDGERLVGIVTSLDLVRLVAEGRVRPA